jgi:hypothetical protein
MREELDFANTVEDKTVPCMHEEAKGPYRYKKKFHGLSPRANYNDRATAVCRRS